MRELAHSALKYYLREFPIRKGKARLLSYLWKPLSFQRYRRSTRLRQAPVQMECDLTKLLQRQLYFFGGYEEENCAYWIERAREAQVIFDVGANVGLYSLLAASANPAAEVHAFEPTPEIFSGFTNNIRLNNLTRITANHAAVGRENGSVFLQLCTGADGANEGMNYVDQQRHSSNDYEVRSVTLDQYCLDHGIERIDLLKMDIEGGEYNALMGSERLLRTKAIRCIFLELIEWAANRSGSSTVDIKRHLAEMGYKMFLKSSSGLQPVGPEGTHNGDNIIAFAEAPEGLR